MVGGERQFAGSFEQDLPAPQEYGLPPIVGMGGGGGLKVIASGLRPHIRENQTALVGTFDSGGGTGDLRTEYGGMAVGDVRNVCQALSTLNPDTLTGLSRKFKAGTGNSKLNVHNQAPGNIFIANLVQLFPDDPERIAAAYMDLYRTEGQVLPITSESRHLKLTTPDGVVLDGEHEIDDTEIPNLKGSELTLDQKATLGHAAALALRKAKLVVGGLGDVFTSVGPNFLVDGVTEIVEEKPFLFIVNLMNPEFQTHGFTAVDILEEIKRLNGGVNVVNRVMYNTRPLNKEALKEQMDKGSTPVTVDIDDLHDHGYHDIVGYDLASDIPPYRDPEDSVKNRAAIVHDAGDLGNAIMREFYLNHLMPTKTIIT